METAVGFTPGCYSWWGTTDGGTQAIVRKIKSLQTAQKEIGLLFAIRVRCRVLPLAYGRWPFPRVVYNEVSTMPFSGPTTPNVCKLATGSALCRGDSCLPLKAPPAFSGCHQAPSGSIRAARFLKFRGQPAAFMPQHTKAIPLDTHTKITFILDQFGEKDTLSKQTKKKPYF